MNGGSGIGIVAGMLVIGLAVSAYAQDPGSVGLRGGIGTDITGGIAYGGEINYTLPLAANAFELGLGIYGGSFDEETEEGIHVYEETTDIFVVAALANYLFRYSMDTPGPYFVAGVGFGGISVEWEERSSTDTSLGTPLPGGGSMQAEDGTSGGVILNLGIGQRITENFDLRAQVPTFFIPGAPGDATNVAPTFTLTAGIRF
jgi:hypothetical protein